MSAFSRELRLIDILPGLSDVSDSAGLIKTTAAGIDELIVYVVLRPPSDPTTLIERIRRLLHPAPERIHPVPVFKLPLRPDGSLDHTRLAAIPVLDRELLEAAGQTLQRTSGVSAALVIARDTRPADATRYHLSDVLPRVQSDEPRPTVRRAPAGGPDRQSDRFPAAVVDGPKIPALAQARRRTLLDAFQDTLGRYSDQAIFFISADGQVVEWSYAELWQRAATLHARCVDAGLRPTTPVIVQSTDNADILTAFWACQMGGYIPVILEVPTDYAAGNPSIDRLLGLYRVLDSAVIAADPSVIAGFADSDIPDAARLRFIDISGGTLSSTRIATHHAADPEDIALFNLTSGSTGVPKCIMLSHRNLLTRAVGANHLVGYRPTDVILNWLPFVHIGSISDWHVRCILLGCRLIYVDKRYILGDIANWLALLDRFRVTHSWAPNFAFALVGQQAQTDDGSDWDLSCVQGLLTAGEAVSERSVQGFLRAGARFGLASTTIQPAFGMAEVGSGITYFVPTQRNPVRFHRLINPAMGDSVERVSEENPDAGSFADLGPPIPGVSLRIVDLNHLPLPMETIGKLQVRGDVVFRGYFKHPEATAAALRSDGWFDTGDLGFLTEGNLVLTGREKETIIVNGVNYSSHEIEDTVNHIAGIASGYTAACAVRCSRDRDEQLAVFFVPDVPDEADVLIRRVRLQIADRHGISPGYLLPLDRSRIPKTAIGKIQRGDLKRRLEEGDLDAVVRRTDLVLANQYTLPRWFYRRVWVRKKRRNQDSFATSGCSLILEDGCGLAELLRSALRDRGRPTVTASPGHRFQRIGRSRFTLDLSETKDFRRLFETVCRDRDDLDEIIVMIDYDLSGAAATEPPGIEVGLFRNISCLLNLLHAANELGIANRLKRVVWVSSQAQTIQTDEPGVPEKAMMSAVIQSLSLEPPFIDCLHIDLDYRDHETNATLLVGELAPGSRDPIVAYRRGQRSIPRIRQLDLVAEPRQPILLDSRALYAVTGGLGGIGFEICRRIGRLYRARILLIGRRPLSSGLDVGSDPMDPAGRRYLDLRAEGIDCEYAVADVGIGDALTAVIERAEQTSGRGLAGIFHIAGEARAAPLADETPASFRQLARAKIDGTRALSELLKDRPGCFLVAFSSVNAVFGGMDAGLYAAVNAYMDAYCRMLARTGLRTLCISWSLWNEVGMGLGSPELMAAANRKGFASISTESGFHSLLAALCAGHTDIIIGLDASKGPIQENLDNDCFVQREVVGIAENPDRFLATGIPDRIALVDRFGIPIDCPVETVGEIPRTPDGALDPTRLDSIARGQAATPRAPENETEAALVEIWCDLLRTTNIGTRDNFFDLGGDSLRAIQLVARIARRFDVKLPVSAVFHAPTVESLARECIGDPDSERLFSTVPIRGTGSKMPLFIIQSVGQKLIAHLASDHPVYAFNYGVGAKDPARMLELPARLEDLASHYVSEMVAIQRDGPYAMIGHSAAGLIAYEMARQLAEKGQSIQLLAMIDTYYIAHRLARSERSHLRLLVSGFKSPPARLIRMSTNWIYHRLRKFYFRFLSRRLEVPISIRARHLFNRYNPPEYPGRVSYIKCTRRRGFERERDDEDHWKRLAKGGVDVYPIPCHHDEIMNEPYVGMLADVISRELPP